MACRRTHILLRLVLTMVFIVGVWSPASALAPTGAFYVNDYVGVLSDPAAEYLVQRGQHLYAQNGVQVVAVIVGNFVGESMAAYANRVFNEFGIGSQRDNNGVLLIVAVDDGEVRIEVGDGLSAQIPDSKAGAILDESFMPAAMQGDLAEAVYATYLELIREGSRLDTTAPPPPARVQINWVSVFIGLLLVLAGIMVLVAASRRRRWPYTPPPPYPGQPGRPQMGPPWPSSGPAPTGRTYPGGPLPLPRTRVGPIVRFPPAGSWGSSPPTPRSPARPSHGAGGRSTGGGAGRTFPSDGSVSRPAGGIGSRRSSGGFGGGASRPSGGSSRPSSGGGGRSSGGGAGRGFKK